MILLWNRLKYNQSKHLYLQALMQDIFLKF